MPIVIRKDDERFTLPLAAGAGVYYSRLGQKAQQKMINDATGNRGNINWGRVTSQMIKGNCHGWYGFLEPDGTEAEFDPEMLLDQTSDLCAKIIDAITEQDPTAVGATSGMRPQNLKPPMPPDATELAQAVGQEVQLGS